MKLTPRYLQIILLVTMVLIVIGGAVIFQFAKANLATVAKDAAQISADAEASQTTVTRLQQTERDLTANQQAVQRASKIAAESREYLYQDQIIKDLNTFARRNGVTIQGIDFGGSSSATPGASSSGTATTPLPTPSVSGGGLKSINAAITLKSPIRYESFLRFIRDIEQNLTKMQLSSLSLSNSDTGITSDTLNVQVYVRG